MTMMEANRPKTKIDALREIDGVQARALGELYAVRYDQVVDTISENDTMFYDNREVYALTGRSALAALHLAMLNTGKDIGAVSRVLDFACGYGRVLRYLKVGFPNARIYACEVDRGALEFCQSTFDVIPAASRNADDGDAVDLPEAMDVIWVGSLFTHFDIPAWRSFLRMFCDALAPNGLLVFSVASELAVLRRRFVRPVGEAGGESLERGYRDTGFGFAKYQKKIDEHVDYGLSAVKPGWVVELLREFPKMRLVSYTKMGWVLGQDVVCCIKQSETLFEQPEVVARARADHG